MASLFILVDTILTAAGRTLSIFYRLQKTRFYGLLPETRVGVYEHFKSRIVENFWLGEGPYYRLAAARLLLGREEEAWPAAERAVGRALADMLVAAGQRALSAVEGRVSEQDRSDELPDQPTISSEPAGALAATLSVTASCAPAGAHMNNSNRNGVEILLVISVSPHQSLFEPRTKRKNHRMNSANAAAPANMATISLPSHSVYTSSVSAPSSGGWRKISNA